MDFIDIVRIIVLIVLVMILIRELCLWYWKINRIVELLENIERNTSKNTVDESDAKYKNGEVDLLKTPLFK